MEKVVAFIDILGFSSYVNNDIQDAIMVLTNANAIIDQLIFEKSIHPPLSYPPEIQNLALRTSITSIEDYLPFSDSVFITSSDASQFVLQLGNFLSSAFLLTARQYATAVDKTDPTKSRAITPVVDPSGQVTVDRIDTHIPPVLFRGGMAFGEVERIKPSAIVDGTRVNMWSLAGSAVFQAVGLEGSFKGPRIVFESDIYNLLDAQARMYCRELPECPGRYEILWPAMNYILENPYSGEFHIFYEYMDAVFNLWKVFENDHKVGIQYEKFMEIIIASAINIYNQHWRQKQFAVEKITKYLRQKGILAMFQYLLV